MLGALDKFLDVERKFWIGTIQVGFGMGGEPGKFFQILDGVQGFWDGGEFYDWMEFSDTGSIGRIFGCGEE